MDFRYAQFCPLTRAVEILGERWTILILRELFLGPKRFSDLRSALNGISPSVLAERLARLEERRIVARRELPPPAASVVYELDEAGRALRPLLVELTRWGVRFMGAPGPSDVFRPEWLLLGLQVFAHTRATDDIGAHLHVEGGAESVDIYVRGTAAGTTVSRTPLPYEVSVSAPPMEMLTFVNGFIAPGSEGTPPAFTWRGDVEVARRIPSLFDFRSTPSPPDTASGPSQDRTGSSPSAEPPASDRGARTKRKPAAAGCRTTAARGSKKGAAGS